MSHADGSHGSTVPDVHCGRRRKRRAFQNGQSMKLNLLTYATSNFAAQAQSLVESAMAAGFDSATVCGPQDIAETAFYTRNAVVLSALRGAGFWLWKPHLLLERVRRLAADECILYSDAGRTAYYAFTARPRRLIARMAAGGQGFLLGCPVAHMGPIRVWTKRDCLEIMGAAEGPVRDAPLLMTWSLWTNTPQAIAFLESWLAYASDPRCLTDWPNVLGKPDLPDFREHRFDQSIMSILAYQKAAPRVDFSRSLVQRLIEMRPGSELANTFYKRPQNAEDLLSGYGPAVLVREYLRLRRFKGQ